MKRTHQEIPLLDHDSPLHDDMACSKDTYDTNKTECKNVINDIQETCDIRTVRTPSCVLYESNEIPIHNRKCSDRASRLVSKEQSKCMEHIRKQNALSMSFSEPNLCLNNETAFVHKRHRYTTCVTEVFQDHKTDNRKNKTTQTGIECFEKIKPPGLLDVIKEPLPTHITASPFFHSGIFDHTGGHLVCDITETILSIPPGAIPLHEKVHDILFCLINFSKIIDNYCISHPVKKSGLQICQIETFFIYYVLLIRILD